MSNEISSEIEQFVLQNFDSTEQLEVLLLVASEPKRAWTPAAIYNAVKTNPDSITRCLQGFRDRGYLAVASDNPLAYRFTPQSPELPALLSKLAVFYKDRMHRVIELIYTKPPSAVRHFADAFRLRKD